MSELLFIDTTICGNGHNSAMWMNNGGSRLQCGLVMLSTDQELMYHENSGSANTPINGLIMMHENEIDINNEHCAWDVDLTMR